MSCEADERERGGEPKTPEYFVVRVNHPDKLTFVICQALLEIDATKGLFGVPAEFLASRDLAFQAEKVAATFFGEVYTNVGGPGFTSKTGPSSSNQQNGETGGSTIE